MKKKNDNLTLVLDIIGKFGRAAHVRGGQITDIAKIFTDRQPPKNIVDQVVNSAAELVICEEGLTS